MPLRLGLYLAVHSTRNTAPAELHNAALSRWSQTNIEQEEQRHRSGARTTRRRIRFPRRPIR